MNYTVSVIIPCRNEEKYIEKCITSILSSNYPKELISVYVCDGMSDDNTSNIVSLLAKNNKQIHLLINKNQTTPYALNLGLKESKADIKIILGAHAEIDIDFIKGNVEVLSENEDLGCSGGVIENVYENRTAEIIGLAMSSTFGVGNAYFRTGSKNGFVDTVAFGAYKKEVFESIGFFDEDLVRNQDDEFNFRMLKYGFKIYLSNKINSKYYVRGSFSKLFKQYYQYGFWKVLVNKKHKTITTLRQLIPSLFVLFLISGGVLSFIQTLFFYSYISIIFLYFGLAFVFALKKTKEIKTLFVMIFVFFELHLSYGLGYLVGIFYFIILNKRPSKSLQALSR